MPYAGFAPQTDVHVLTVPLEGVITQNTVDDRIVLMVPTGTNMLVEVLSVGFTVVTAPAGGSITADIEKIDSTESKSNLATNIDLEALDTDSYNVGYRGSCVLGASEGINIEITTSNHSVTQDDVGLAVIVEYRVLRHS